MAGRIDEEVITPCIGGKALWSMGLYVEDYKLTDSKRVNDKKD